MSTPVPFPVISESIHSSSFIIGAPKPFSLGVGSTNEVTHEKSSSNFRLKAERERTFQKMMIQNALKVDLTNSKQLGDGAYGKVITAVIKDKKGLETTVAVKIVSLLKVEPKELTREIEVWKKLKHKNIVRLIRLQKISLSMYLVMEYGAKGDLVNHLLQHGPFSEKHGKPLFKQVVEGIDFMHKLDIAHRDIKPDNVIMFSGNFVKIADFTLARHMVGMSETFCGTFNYAAPEVCNKEAYCPFAADVWSLGMLLYCILVGALPYSEEDSPKTVFKIQLEQSHLDNLVGTVSVECMAILRASLQYEPFHRCSCQNILEVPW